MPLPTFSFMGKASDHPQQIPCYITHTNEQTHDFIRNGLKDSPMVTGNIEGVLQNTVLIFSLLPVFALSLLGQKNRTQWHSQDAQYQHFQNL
jgi:hypothetical protein